MRNIDYRLKEFYETCNKVWPDDNRWYDYTRKQICKTICKFINDGRILNAGSGGSTYGLPFNMYHVDIAENKINRYKDYIVANIEELPFSDEIFNSVICVGSVLNYCKLSKTINELYRVVKKRGIIILEYESSYSFEFMNKDFYGCNDTIVSLQYMGEENKQHLYSPMYINSILEALNIDIIYQKHFHIISSLLSNIISDDNVLGWVGYLDGIGRVIPLFKRHAGNIILVCRK